MANFNLFISTILKHEGGFVDDPLDRGGATNKGITMKTFQDTAQSILGIAPTLENLKNLTDAQAGEIYKARYWDKIKGDDIELQDLANIMFDFAVNSGPGRAAKYLQSILQDMGENISVDGAIGPNTLNALSRVDSVEVYRQYKQRRIEFYHKIVENNPSQERFLKGWLNRINSFPDL